MIPAPLAAAWAATKLGFAKVPKWVKVLLAAAGVLLLAAVAAQKAADAITTYLDDVRREGYDAGRDDCEAAHAEAAASYKAELAKRDAAVDAAVQLADKAYRTKATTIRERIVTNVAQDPTAAECLSPASRELLREYAEAAATASRDRAKAAGIADPVR